MIWACFACWAVIVASVFFMIINVIAGGSHYLTALIWAAAAWTWWSAGRDCLELWHMQRTQRLKERFKS